MTALLTADEAARLRVGVNVIVRPGAQPTCQQPSERDDGTLCGSDYEVSLVDVVRYEGEGESTFFHLPICYGHRLALAEHVIAYESAPVVAPQAWVALTGPCPTCDGAGGFSGVIPYKVARWKRPCPDCQDGRRIVPLYTECPNHHAMRGGWADCLHCDENGRVLVGRGSIEVVPVVKRLDVGPFPLLNPQDNDFVIFTLDPLPVPGRDFGIVIDCVEVAS